MSLQPGRGGLRPEGQIGGRMSEVILLDSSVIIGARKGEEACREVLLEAEQIPGRFFVTPEVAGEVGQLPPGVSVWREEGAVAFDPKKTKANVDKEFGGPGGSRKPPSDADLSLIELCKRVDAVVSIVARDSDIEHAYYALPKGIRERVDLLEPEEYVS